MDTKVTKEDLKKYAELLMFDMKEEEYDTLLKEFETIEKHMALIGNIKDIDKVEPMTFPYVIYHSSLREDINKPCLTTEEVLKNTKDKKADQVKVPKVVGE